MSVRNESDISQELELRGLPVLCYTFVGSNSPGSRVVVVRRGHMGYWATDFDHAGLSHSEAKDLADRLNGKLGLAPDVVAAMVNGSMFGWSCKAAMPEFAL